MTHNRPTGKNRLSLAWSQLLRLIGRPRPPATRRPYPKLRNFILDVMAEGRRKNIINLLFEADVTSLRIRLARHREQTGEHLSLTACLAGTLAAAIEEDLSMQAYRLGGSKLVLFEEIDLAVMIERELEDGTLPVTSIVRAANEKGIGGIHRELQAAKSAPLGEDGPMPALEKYFFGLPLPLRKIIWLFIRRDPYLFKQLAGTVGVTSMGMHAGSPMVLLPITPMTLTLSIGSIGKKLVLAGNQPVEREMIQLNLGADHDVIDGAPLVRFAERFRKLLEEGAALEARPRLGRSGPYPPAAVAPAARRP